MSRIKISIAIVLWLAIAVFDTGALNANSRGRYPRLDQSEYQARSDFTFSLGMSLLFAPFVLIESPFITTLYYYGWTLNYQPFPCTEKDTVSKEVWCHADN